MCEPYKIKIKLRSFKSNGHINEKGDGSYRGNLFSDPIDLATWEVDTNKIKLRSFKSSECFNEKGDGPYRGFGYLSLFSDPIDSATWSKKEFL